MHRNHDHCIDYNYILLIASYLAIYIASQLPGIYKLNYEAYDKDRNVANDFELVTTLYQTTLRL